MKFLIIVSLLVALFVLGVLAYPRIPEFIDSISPKSTPVLDSWVDPDSVTYDSEQCRISFEWVLTNEGDPATNVQVLLKAVKEGQTLSSEEVLVGTIEKGRATRRQNFLQVPCDPAGNVVYLVESEVISYSQ